MNKVIFITGVILACTAHLRGQDTALTSRIRTEIETAYSRYDTLYKHLHQNSELSYQEKETSALLKGHLRSLGFEITDSLGGYGFAGIYRNGVGPVILYRTDMDALPIKEKTGLPYASDKTSLFEGKETSVMHACGHGMHMTIFTVTAETLLKLKAFWKGTLVLLAQSAEEKGGAQVLLRNGLFSKLPVPDVALAIHVTPELETGKVGYCPGPAYASVGTVDITVFGQGGHGAYPHLGIDPVVLTSRHVGYGEELVYSGPVFNLMEIADERTILQFEHVGGGLCTKDKHGYLDEFEICGPDGIFHWAKAFIEDDRVIVYNKNVPEPVAVRYAWSGNPERANLYNMEGLPASPFRTDRLSKK